MPGVCGQARRRIVCKLLDDTILVLKKLGKVDSRSMTGNRLKNSTAGRAPAQLYLGKHRFYWESGAPGGIRTPDLLVRSSF
jgi:hypothetical protein